MLFNIEMDQGDKIAGYVVPDDFTQTATLRLVENGEQLGLWVCHESRPALVAAGRHATGICGFVVDVNVISDLPQRQRLEIYDQDTGLLLYRRRLPEEVTQKRVFRLETHLFPLWSLDRAIEYRFQYFNTGVERFGRETTTQVFLLLSSKSMYISGRLAFKAYDNYLYDNFISVLLIQDPYFELAERLLTLKIAENFGEELLGARDTLAFKPAMAFAKSLPTDEDGLHKAFTTISKPVISLLSDPLTRQLSCENLEDPLPKKGFASALESLSSFAIVGTRARQDYFLEELEHLCQMSPGVLPPPRYFDSVASLAAQLKVIPEAKWLLENDLQIYHTVQSACETVL